MYGVLAEKMVVPGTGANGKDSSCGTGGIESSRRGDSFCCSVGGRRGSRALEYSIVSFVFRATGSRGEGTVVVRRIAPRALAAKRALRKTVRASILAAKEKKPNGRR